MSQTITCDPALRTTRSLLGYGVIAGPIYVLVSLTEALTRDGFDLRRHTWSLLSNGHLGWIHITTFLVSGLMTVAFAVGLRRAQGPGSVWAPRLVGGYGVSLLCAGVFRADPALGFPAGTPDKTVSWHGIAHLAAGGVGFACLVAACFVIARRLADPAWAAFSRATGVAVLAGFLCVAAGAGQTWANLTFTAAVIASWAWLCALAVHLYREPASPAEN
jgi:hypothetical protein